MKIQKSTLGKTGVNVTDDDIKEIFGPGGAIEAFAEANLVLQE